MTIARDSREFSGLTHGHAFELADIEQAFHMMETKEDGFLEPLIHF
jgi:hypothetical protein